MNLAMLKPGEKGRITKIGAIGPLKRRLMDMGALTGEPVRVEKVAPLGDPIEITLSSNFFSKLKLLERNGRTGGGPGLKILRLRHLEVVRGGLL